MRGTATPIPIFAAVLSPLLLGVVLLLEALRALDVGDDMLFVAVLSERSAEVWVRESRREE